MPALEARLDRFDAAHTQVLGVSVDSMHSHANWAASMGGISFPLLADFHPKGELGQKLGVYVDAAGLNMRSTVLIDGAGRVRIAEPAKKARDMEALVERCRELDVGFQPALPDRDAPAGLPPGSRLFIKDDCGFSRAVSLARTNLHLEVALPMSNVSRDAAAMDELRKLSGGEQAPYLTLDGEGMLESGDIVSTLVARTAPL